MKRLIVVLTTMVILSGCGDMCGDDSVGEMRCNGNLAQMCNAYNSWETYQDCGAIGEVCSTSPTVCGGYTGIACCY